MAVIRHSNLQEYANPAAVIAETLVPKNNDSIYVDSLNRTFAWKAGSAATADDVYVIDQTTETGNGRWIASSFTTAITGTGNTSALLSGQSEILDITVTGAALSTAYVVAVTNGNTIPTNVYITSKEVVAANTVRVVVENQSGTSVATFAINLTLLSF